MSQRVLYVISCGAPPAGEVDVLVRLAHERDWDVCVLTTPSGRKFADTGELERLTGHPIRSEYKNPGDPDVLPEPDAIIVAPATVNSINKWAAGICDTLALGILVEAIGKKLPLVAVPFTNSAHAAHPAFRENIARLRSWGVTILFERDAQPLHAPGTGADHMHLFPWRRAIEAVEDAARRGPPGGVP
jgi:phosphopantothenoylcysteine synthetase/decarboxylase